MEENPVLENLIAKRYINRTDVKAVQATSRTYNPLAAPWSRLDIRRHLNGLATYGHYLIKPDDDSVKLFVLDLDIKTGEGFLPTIPMIVGDETVPDEWERSFQSQDLRAAWADRRNPARTFMKYQMKTLAGKFMRVIHEDLEIPTAAAYSGSKGLHIYGFTGILPASDARDAAEIVLDKCDWRLYKGASKYEHRGKDPIVDFTQYDVEVYPKQGSLEGKDLGNLVRLPLGKNKKAPKDPTFFLDMRRGLTDWTPADPIWALTTDNPWMGDVS